MANIKKYTIEINGLKESTSAVDALNRQLDALEQRINKINSTKVSTGGSGSGSRGSSSTLSEEEAVQKEINKLKQQGAQLDAKIAASQDEIFKRVDATKQLYKETLADQKAIAAQERLTANVYSNTMQGMKNKLADLKSVINTTDLGDSDKIKTLTKEANELTSKLKEMEEAYGQFGRNVGNYSSAFDKIKVTIGESVREFNNYREAIKTLKQERFTLSQTLGTEAEQYKEIDNAVKKLESDYNDLNKSSAFMDGLLDTMEGFTALASVGQGLSALFGIDNTEIQKSIQRLVALQNVLKGIEKLRLQMQKGEGIGKWLDAGSKSVDKFVAKITGAEVSVNGLTMATKTSTIAVRGLSLALKSIGIGLILGGIAMLTSLVEKFTSSADSAKIKADALVMSLNSLNKVYEKRMDILASSYIKGEITDNQYLSKIYQEQGDNLKKNVGYINEMASALNKMSFTDYLNPMKLLSENTTGYTGSRLTGTRNKTAGEILDWDYISADYSKAFKDVEKAEEEFNKCSEAIKKNMDYFDAYGKGLGDWLRSLIYTVEDTEGVLKGIGNAIAGEYNSRLVDAMSKLYAAQKDVANGVSGAEDDLKQAKATIDELYKKMNSSEAYQSFLANMDKYIPDDKVREKLENILNTFMEFNASANETTAEWASFWAKKRIESMAEGRSKALALLEVERKEEIAKYGDTAEHIQTINEEYARKRIETEKRYGKEYRAAENELANTRIQAMKEGWEKQKAQLDQERKERIQKVKDEGILVGERIIAINNLYDKKVLDAKKKWAEEIENVYRNLNKTIEEINKQTFNIEVNNSNQNVENRKNTQTQNAGYSTINSSNFDDTKTLEEYWAKVLEIEKKANSTLAQIRRESLDKELEYNKKEEELRHERVVNAQNGDLVKELEAGKITQEQYNDLIEKENYAHYARMNALDKEYAAAVERTTQEQLQNEQQLYNDYYANIIKDIETDKAKIDKIMSKQPVQDKAGWGVVNIGNTSSNYKTALSQYDDLKNKIIQKQKELDAALKEKTISPEDFAMRQSELKQEMEAINEAVENVKKKQKELIGEFMQSISGYIQAGMQALQDVMQSIWDAQDNNFDKEQEYLDKLNDELDKKLDEQQDIVQQHKDAINSIEDELATARGDRRQHLIDQLNAEMAAQRAAQQQEKKIQKEKEAAQKKQDALDLKRKKAQYKRDMLQAVVNGAMAVTMAAVNAWPVPAVPMMALAAATTAAQIAIMASNKPYAKGGLLEGKSHAQGGIPIPGTGIEVEGKEYVVRKKSTAPNIDLLEYINKSERKLDLSDFIDFYSGDKPKKAIRSVRNKFEDGGYMPALPNALDVRDQLQNVIVNQDNRPIVVSVVDINSKQEEVRRVQTLAGLEV